MNVLGGGIIQIKVPPLLLPGYLKTIFHRFENSELNAPRAKSHCRFLKYTENPANNIRLVHMTRSPRGARGFISCNSPRAVRVTTSFAN